MRKALIVITLLVIASAAFGYYYAYHKTHGAFALQAKLLKQLKQQRQQSPTKETAAHWDDSNPDMASARRQTHDTHGVSYGQSGAAAGNQLSQEYEMLAQDAPSAAAAAAAAGAGRRRRIESIQDKPDSSYSSAKRGRIAAYNEYDDDEHHSQQVGSDLSLQGEAARGRDAALSQFCPAQSDVPVRAPPSVNPTNDMTNAITLSQVSDAVATYGDVVFDSCMVAGQQSANQEIRGFYIQPMTQTDMADMSLWMAGQPSTERAFCNPLENSAAAIFGTQSCTLIPQRSQMVSGPVSECGRVRPLAA